MLVYIDLETTGFSPTHDSICEVAAVAYADGAEVEAYSTLVYPGEAGYARLQGAVGAGKPINACPLKEIQIAPQPQEAARALRAFIGKHPGASLHSYNIQFDRPFLALEPWGLRDNWGECVMRAAAQGGRWPRLGDAVARFGLAFEGTAHRALDDARMAAKLHWEILRRRVGATAV